MEATKFYNGHRWTMAELSSLMTLWEADEALSEIARKFDSTPNAIRKIVQTLRSNGVPLTRRTKGNISGRSARPWTQGEVEYLLRRRSEKATNEDIGSELGRSECAVGGMIAKLRSEDVPIAMRGNGVRKLWNPNSLKAMSAQMSEITDILLDC